jgi:hypothetical protein
MNKIVYIIFFSLIIISCKSIKKVEKIETAMQAKDTAKAIVIDDIKKIEIVDSVAIARGIVKNIVAKKIDFTTFNAKVKIEYIGQDESQNATAYISMEKDKVIYIRLKATFLGVIAFEAKITKDSCFLAKHVGDKYLKKRSIEYLQDITQVPFDFTTLQDLIIGNPVFIDSSNVVSYRYTNNNQLTILTIGNIFKHLLSVNQENNLITHSKLDDVDIMRNRTCDITYSNYSNEVGFPFSTFRNISLAEKSRLDVNLDFKEYNFNQGLKYSFSLPKKLKLQ